MNPLLAQATTPGPESSVTDVLANLSVDKVVLIALTLTIIRILLLNPLRKANPGKPLEAGGPIRAVAEVFESLIIALVLVFLIIRPFFVQAFYIPSESMEPTLLGHDAGDGPHNHHDDTVHDHIFVNKLVFRYSKPQHGDIVVFRAPKEADMESKMNGRPQVENVLIKRCIGVPGDKIEVKGGAVYRNDQRLNEPYIKEPMDDPQPSPAIYGVDKEGEPPHPITLQPNQYFMMGDNRNDSNDSRYWGPLDGDRVIGKATLVFFPLNRLHILH